MKKAPDFPVISEQKTPLEGARSLEDWKSKEGEWKDAEGNAFIQDASIWAAARDWAIEYELISEGLDASTYFTNEYLR